MRIIEQTTRFKKDLKREKKGRYKKHLELDMIEVLKVLVSDLKLEERCFDHALSNNWKDHRDCHIKPDLILIYRKFENILQLVRLGSHSELEL